MSSGGGEGDGIEECLPSKLELLLCCERDGVGDVADVEVWDEAEDALLLLGLDLGLGYFLRRGCDLDVDCGGDGWQGDLRSFVDLSGVESARCLRRDEVRRRRLESLKETGSDAGEGESGRRFRRRRFVRLRVSGLRE